MDSSTDPHLRGETRIENSVVAKIAGIAARKVSGVYAFGDSGAKSFGRSRQPSTHYARGIHVEVGATEIAADVTIIAEFGVQLQELCDRVREAVLTSLERLVGKRVIEVNVDVADVYIPDAERPPRDNKERA